MKYKLTKNNYKQGFTLVEMVVVIIVIGILVAIGVVVYGELVKRASNTRTIANIKQYHGAMETYKFKVGHYPLLAGEGSSPVTLVCLGYGYVDGRCGVVTGTEVRESADFMKDIQEKSGVNMTGVINERSGAVGGETFTGAVYGIDVVDATYSSTGRGRVIDWIMEGRNQDCVLIGSWGYNSASGNTACEIVLEEF